MKRTIRNTTLSMFLVAAFLLFIPVVLFVGRQDLFEALNAVCIATSTGVCVGYAGTAWRAIKLPPHQMTAAHLVVVAAFIICFFGAIIFAGQYAWRAIGKPDWLIDSTGLAFSRWGIAIGFMLYLATNYSKNGEIVVGAYKRTAALVAVAVFVAAVLIGIGLG